MGVMPSGARHDPPSAAVDAAKQDAAGVLDGVRGGGRLDAARDYLRVQSREDRPWGRIRTGMHHAYCTILPSMDVLLGCHGVPTGLFEVRT